MEGIPFKPWKIKAVADSPDREWQIRLAFSIQPGPGDHGFVHFRKHPALGLCAWWPGESEFDTFEVEPRYHVGEVVYIKEALRHSSIGTPTRYLLDDCPVMRDGESTNWLWQTETLSSMFMPAWAARYFIRITAVRAERVQSITFEDCLAEGVVDSPQWQNLDYKAPEPLDQLLRWISLADRETARGWIEYARQTYASVWDSINLNHPWESNPWVFVYSFKKEGLIK